MKETTKMSRAVGQLEKIYNTLNADKFSGVLPTPIITVQSKPGTYGHCSRGKVWRRKDGEAYEMNIAAEALSTEIEELLDTMLHEMVHLYCRENDIQEVSRGGKYHNKRFKELAEQVGLACYKTEGYGWNTMGHGNDGLVEYALEKGWSEIKIARGAPGLSLGGIGSGTATMQSEGRERREKAPSSTRKYQCPKCGNSVRATKAVNILCGDCMEKMEVVG